MRNSTTQEMSKSEMSISGSQSLYRIDEESDCE